MRNYLFFLFVLMSGVLFSQYPLYNEEAAKVLSGRWKGTEQRVYEWGMTVYKEREPLILDLEIKAEQKGFYYKRFFYFDWGKKGEEKVEMIAQNYAYQSLSDYNPPNFFDTHDENIISDIHHFSYPGILSSMPHYLFEDGYLKFCLKEDKLYLAGYQKIMERTKYTTEWRVFDSGVTRKFRSKDLHGNLIVLEGEVPIVVPGGFFYIHPKDSFMGDENSSFNREMAQYKWILERKLTKNEIKILQPYFSDPEMNKMNCEILDENKNQKQDNLKTGTSKENTNPVNPKEIKVISENIEILIFDNSVDDGDMISVFLNDQLVGEHIEVKKIGEKLDIKLKKGKNKLTILAENEGKIPPNTAGLTFTDEKTKQTITLKNKKRKRKSLIIYVE